MSGLTRPAQAGELAGLWPIVGAAHVFDSFAEFEAWSAEAPWKVRSGGPDEAVVLGRWREHLDLLAVQGMWCQTRRIPVLLADLFEVAKEQGFGRLLGPMVPETVIGPYLASGMSVHQRIVVCRLRMPRAPVRAMPEGVTLRPGGPADAEAMIDVDRACFDEFWRYDAEWLRRLAASERVILAERSGEVIGYTLTTVRGVEATVGRLAVVTGERRAGVGMALLSEAVSYADENGAAAVTLCTQEGNAASRRLYRRAGFQELAGRLAIAISPPLAGEGR